MGLQDTITGNVVSISCLVPAGGVGWGGGVLEATEFGLYHSSFTCSKLDLGVYDVWRGGAGVDAIAASVAGIVQYTISSDVSSIP